MVDRNNKSYYERWLSQVQDLQLLEELHSLSEEQIQERFYKYLEFGTAGMRGELGAGTNRMNVYLIRRATEGLARYIVKLGTEAMKAGVAIAYDSRHYSQEFAEQTALVLAKHNIKSFMYESIRPTPMLSFAVRELRATAGIMVTASHNPPEYNGYKVYWEDGGQIPPSVADALMKEIQQVENELIVKLMDKEEAIQRGLLKYIGQEVDNKYYQKLRELVLQQKMNQEEMNSITIVYTPLHGAGSTPVQSILNQAGFQNVFVVPEQKEPDPNFSTVKTPNPEDREAFDLAIRLAENVKADLILGTDPDADRVGVVVKNNEGDYIALTGNQIGALLLEYILSQKKKREELPTNGVVLKSIVTSELGRKIAESYGIETIDTLTGFKFIGEKILEYETTGEKQFLFGYEESYGYLISDFVRDKDAVQACLLICEMAAYNKSNGSTIFESLMKLYERYGYFIDDVVSLTVKGIDGQEQIRRIMNDLRNNLPIKIGDFQVNIVSDFLNDQKKNLLKQTIYSTGLPKSDVLQFTLEDGSWFAIRPSGTESKLKIYFSVLGNSAIEAESKLHKIKDHVMKRVEQKVQ